MLIGLMLHLATRGKPETCTLVEMWKILNNAKLLKKTIEAMAGSRELMDTISTIGENLSETESKNPEQLGNFRVGAAEAVAIFDPLGHLGQAVSASNFRFEDLKTGKTSIYLVIPADDRIHTYGSWLGLLTRQAITAVARSAGKAPVLFMLDEFTNMGKLAGLSESLTALPGLGVRVWAFVQELSEIKRVYGDHTHATLLSQAEVKQYFAVQSPELSKELSERLGQKTVKVVSNNLGKTPDDEIGETLSEIGRPLIATEDIRQMPEKQQLLFIGALPPIRAKLMWVWDVAPWQDHLEPNPVEGGYPKPPPKVTLQYDKVEERGYA
jgi:type IV secretion system protein VirD4